MNTQHHINRYTVADIKHAVQAARNNGHTLSVIAEDVGCAMPTLSALLKRDRGEMRSELWPALVAWLRQRGYLDRVAGAPAPRPKTIPELAQRLFAVGLVEDCHEAHQVATAIQNLYHRQGELEDLLIEAEAHNTQNGQEDENTHPGEVFPHERPAGHTHYRNRGPNTQNGPQEPTL